MADSRFETPDDLFDAENRPLAEFEREGEDDAAEAPTLLTLPEPAVTKRLWAQWHAQEKTAHARNVATEVNRRRRKGDRYVAMVKSQDRDEYRVYAPPATTRTPPALNKSARSVRRVVALLFTDPAVPEATPATDSDEDRQAAEFATRWLQAIGGESGLNTNRSAFRAMDRASTYRSAFRHWYVDPQGGGSEAITILADPQALTAEEATHRRVQRPVLDALGAPQLDAAGQPVTEEAWEPQPGPFVTRYVKQGGELTDVEAEAERRWLPRLRCDILTSRNVRLVPEFCDGIDDAEMALVCLPVTVGALKRQFPDTIGQYTNDQLKKLVGFRPQHHPFLVPPHLSDEQLQGATEANGGKVPDDAMAFVLTAYQRPTPELPKGAHIIVAGESCVCHRGEWDQVVDGRWLAMEIPLDQFRQFSEGEADPMGISLMDLLGAGDELLQAQWGAFLEHLDRFNNRKTFVPLTSSFQPQQGQMATGSYVTISGGEPKTETVPEYPRTSVEFLKMVQQELDDESGLQQAGQGLDSPNVQSGFHASLVMERVQSALAELHQNASAGLIRGWRIQLQLARAFFPDQQTLRTLGDDQAFKQLAWRGADFRNTTDVQLQRASFTMMTPTQKTMVAQNMQLVGALTVPELKRIVIGNVGGLLGAQDDPFLLEVRRAIAQWELGPEENGNTSPFPLDSHHDEPAVAAVRHTELSRVLASTKSHRWPTEWRQHLLAAYEQARNAAAAAAQPMMPGMPGSEPAPAGDGGGAPLTDPSAPVEAPLA